MLLTVRSIIYVLLTAFILTACGVESKKGSVRATLAEATAEYKNPIIKQRADPWVYKHKDGYYYFSGTVPEYDRIELRRAKTIQGLGEAQPIVVWTKRESGPKSKNIWAPELHYIDGKWYIYFAAARMDAPFDHRIYVLENASANPLEGTWVEKGRIHSKWETFSIRRNYLRASRKTVFSVGAERSGYLWKFKPISPRWKIRDN